MKDRTLARGRRSSLTRRRALLLGGLALLAGTGCRSDPAGDDPPVDPDLVAIRAANRAMERHLCASEIEALTRIYDDAGVIAAPDGQLVQGSVAIADYWRRLSRPLDWKLEILALEPDPEGERRGAARRRIQEGRSTLVRLLSDGRRRESVVLFEVVWEEWAGGSWRILSDAYWSPGADYRTAIEVVLTLDDVAGRERNRVPLAAPMHVAVEGYLRALDALEQEGLPGDFCLALRHHRDAWQALVEPLRAQASERGEMHAVFERLTAAGTSDGAVLQGLLGRVWATWREVERSRDRHCGGAP